MVQGKEEIRSVVKDRVQRTSELEPAGSLNNNQYELTGTDSKRHATFYTHDLSFVCIVY